MKFVMIIAILTFLSFPAAAQEVSSATVISVQKDRTGKRFANRWQVRCDAPGQVWSTGILNKSTRKMYVHAGSSPLRIGLAAPPNSIGEILNGTKIEGWSTLLANQGKNYGQPAQLTVVCTGAGEFYAHAEWHRRVTSLFDLP